MHNMFPYFLIIQFRRECESYLFCANGVLSVFVCLYILHYSWETDLTLYHDFRSVFIGVGRL